MSKKLGYIRVSTVVQNTARQLDGIELDKVFEDKVSGKSTNRPALAALLDYARDGDIIFVHSLDRLARNLDDLRKIVNQVTAEGIEIRFVKENLTFKQDTNALSQLLLSVMGAFAEFERNLILERQREGIEIARRAGKYEGRKPKLNKNMADKITGLVQAGVPIMHLAKEFNLSRTTIYKVIKDDYRCADQNMH